MREQEQEGACVRERLSWIPPKCKQGYPCKREAEGDLRHTRKRKSECGHGSRDGNDVATSHRMPAATKAEDARSGFSPRAWRKQGTPDP